MTDESNGTCIYLHIYINVADHWRTSGRDLAIPLFSKDDSYVRKRILPLDRLAGVRAHAPRVRRGRLMALQKGAKVEHAGLPARGGQPGALPRIRLARCQLHIRSDDTGHTGGDLQLRHAVLDHDHLDFLRRCGSGHRLPPRFYHAETQFRLRVFGNQIQSERTDPHFFDFRLRRVSGINIHLIGTVVCVVCVFYTVLGGIRAVVWTDALQVGVMIAAVISVTVLGTYQIGGVSEVWSRAIDANRIVFLNLDPSPYTRHTVWTVLFGSWLYSTAYIAVNQTMVQRYRSLKDTRTSKLSIALFTVGIMVFISLCCWCGLVLLAWWSPPKCDPRASGLITADDQLLPAYVMEIAQHLHGIPGLFVAGIFGAALSSLSVGFNSTSVVILEDFVKGCFKMKPSDRCSTIFVKTLIVLLGLLALSFIFVVEKLGGVLAITGSLAAIAAGTSFGVFTLGILFPWANSKGAFVGAIAGFIVAGWASFGANIAIGSGLVMPKKLPVPLSHCGQNISYSFLQQFEWPNEDDVFPLYRLSYHWFAPLGTLVVLVVGGLITLLTGKRDPASIDRSLLSPVIHRWLPQRKCQDDVDGWPVSGEPQTSLNLIPLRVCIKSQRPSDIDLVKKEERPFINGSS